MAILNKPLGQNTRQDIILRLRKENEKEGYEQRQSEQEEDHTLFHCWRKPQPLLCVCSESDYLQSLVPSESNPLIHCLFFIRVGNETSKGINIHYSKDPDQREL